MKKVLIALGVLGVAACGSDSGTNTVVSPGTTLSISGSSTAQLGQALQLTATIQPGGSTVSATWSSSSTSIATVDQNGKVLAQLPGTATISAKNGSNTATLTLTVAGSVSATKDTIFTLPQAWTPPNLTIKQGNSVTFVFGGAIEHNALFRSTNPAGNPPDIQNFTNKTFSRTFSSTGSFTFDCTVHPGMTGVITVTP